MSFNANETGVRTGEPVYLYQFAFGGDSYNLTNLDQPVTVGGVAYTPTTIKHTAPKQARQKEAQATDVTLPVDHAIPSRFYTSVPGKLGTLKVYKVHFSDIGVTDDTIKEFDGTVNSMKVSGDVAAVLKCYPMTAKQRRAGPRINYSAQCPHILGDARCGVNIASFAYTGTVTGVNNRQITVNGASAIDAVGGMVEAPYGSGDDYRMVLAQSGDNLLLMMPFEENPNGTTVRVFAGCDHTTTDCNTKFSNLVNYGGFPFVPTENPHNSELPK